MPRPSIYKLAAPPGLNLPILTTKKYLRVSSSPLYLPPLAEVTHSNSLAWRKHRAGVAELVDASDSKSDSGNRVWVRFPPPAPFTYPRTSADVLEIQTN
jgi:hypothetical protein